MKALIDKPSIFFWIKRDFLSHHLLTKKKKLIYCSHWGGKSVVLCKCVFQVIDVTSNFWVVFRELFWVSGTYCFVNLFCSWFVLKLSKKVEFQIKSLLPPTEKKNVRIRTRNRGGHGLSAEHVPDPEYWKQGSPPSNDVITHTHTREILFKTSGLFQMTSQVHKSYCLILIPDVTNTFTPIENWQLTKFILFKCISSLRVEWYHNMTMDLKSIVILYCHFNIC